MKGKRCRYGKAASRMDIGNLIKNFENTWDKRNQADGFIAMQEQIVQSLKGMVWQVY